MMSEIANSLAMLNIINLRKIQRGSRLIPISSDFKEK